MISIELTNREEIVRLLDQIPNAYNSKAVRKLIKYAVAPLIGEMKRLAPVAAKAHMGKYGLVEPGTLRDSISTIDLKRSKKVMLLAGPRVKGAFGKVRSGFYGMFLEHGTKTIPARPFMRPAWDSKKEEVIMRFERDAKMIFEKEIRRLTKKGLM